MVKDAAAHADEDKKRRELVDLRNQVDTSAYQVEKLVTDNREKLGDAARGLEEAAAEARKIAEGDDVEAMKQALGGLQQKSQKAAESLYQQTSAPGAGAPPTGEKPKADDVVDAEYTVKN
jgi:molecular chaperone DnaK